MYQLHLAGGHCPIRGLDAPCARWKLYEIGIPVVNARARLGATRRTGSATGSSHRPALTTANRATGNISSHSLRSGREQECALTTASNSRALRARLLKSYALSQRFTRSVSPRIEEMQYDAKTPTEYLKMLEPDWRKDKLMEIRKLIRKH